MRRVSKMKGLKSLFSKAARRVKAFFGWREGTEDAAEDIVAIQNIQCAEHTGKKRRGDGGGEGDSDMMPSPSSKQAQKSNEVQLENRETKRKRRKGNKSVNYALPLGMSEREWERRTAEKQRELRWREREAFRAHVARLQRERALDAIRKREALRRNADKFLSGPSIEPPEKSGEGPDFEMG